MILWLFAISKYRRTYLSVSVTQSPLWLLRPLLDFLRIICFWVMMFPTFICLLIFYDSIIGTMPATFFWPLLGAESTSISIWDGTLEKCKEKHSNCRRQYLSPGGIDLFSLPTNTKALLPLFFPVSMNLDNSRRDFWARKTKIRGPSFLSSGNM